MFDLELASIGHLMCVRDALSNYYDMMENNNIETDTYDSGTVEDLLAETELMLSKQGY